MAEADIKTELPVKRKKQMQIGGVEKAAILLLVIGEQDAAEVMKHMGPKEVQSLGAAMANLGNVSREMVRMVLAEFCDIVDSQTSLGLEAEDYIRNVLVKALGEDKADSLIDRILLGG